MLLSISRALSVCWALTVTACLVEAGQAVENQQVLPCRGAGGNGACPAGTPAHDWQPGGPRLPMRPAVAYACPATLRDVMMNPRYCLSADDGGKFDHKGLCFREIPQAAPWGGHQCCYGDAMTTVASANPQTIYDNCTGTYDLISPANTRCGVGQGAAALACRWAFTRVPGHCRDDVAPWCRNARVNARCVPASEECAADCTTGNTEAACGRIAGCRWEAAQYCWADVPGACAGGPDFDRACSPVATTNCYCSDRINLLRHEIEPGDVELGEEVGPAGCPSAGCLDGGCDAPLCGDGVCDPIEAPPDAAAALTGAPYCSVDCPVCGDFLCDTATEDAGSCPTDCDQDGNSP